MKRIQTLLALILSALIVLTSGSMAAARGQAVAVGEMVICTGLGPRLIRVDENNQPVGPAHYCPDCALSFFDLPLSGGDVVQRLERDRPRSRFFVPVVAKSHPPVLIGARGPPRLVSAE